MYPAVRVKVWSCSLPTMRLTGNLPVSESGDDFGYGWQGRRNVYICWCRGMLWGRREPRVWNWEALGFGAALRL